MIRKIFKILPYCFIMWVTKKFSGDYINTTQLGKCRGFRVDKGEWVLFSEQNYNRMRETENKNKQTKLDKKKARLHKMLDKDYSLKESLKEDFKDEERQRKEEQDDY